MSSNEIHKSSPYTKVTPDDFSPATVFPAHNSPKAEDDANNGSNHNDTASTMTSNMSLYTALEDPWQVYRNKNQVNRGRPNINYNNYQIRYSNDRPLFANNKILSKKMKQRRFRNRFLLTKKKKVKLGSLSWGNHYTNMNTEDSIESNNTDDLYERIINSNSNFKTKEELYNKIDSLNKSTAYHNILPNEILKFSFLENQDFLDSYYGYQYIPPKDSKFKPKTKKFKSNLNNKRKGKFIKHFWKKLFLSKKKKKQNQKVIKKINYADIKLHKVDPATANLIDNKFSNFLEIQKNPNNHLNDSSSSISVKIITNGAMADLNDIAPPTSPDLRKRFAFAKNRLILQLMKFNPSIKSQIVYPEHESIDQAQLQLRHDICTNAFERFEFEDGINYGVMTKTNANRLPKSNDVRQKGIHQTIPDAEFDELVNNKNASPLKKSDIESPSINSNTSVSERTNSSDSDNAHNHHYCEYAGESDNKFSAKKKKNYIDFLTPPLNTNEFDFVANNDDEDKRISVATVTPADEIENNDNGKSESPEKVNTKEVEHEISSSGAISSSNIAKENFSVEKIAGNPDQLVTTEKVDDSIIVTHSISSPSQSISTVAYSVASSKDSVVINLIPVGLATKYDNKRHTSISHARNNPNNTKRKLVSHRTSVLLGSLGLGNSFHSDHETSNTKKSSMRLNTKRNKKKITIDEQLLSTENMVAVDPSFIPRTNSKTSLTRNLSKRKIKTKDSSTRTSSVSGKASINSNKRISGLAPSTSKNNIITSKYPATSVSSSAIAAAVATAAVSSLHDSNRTLSNASSKYSSSRGSYVRKSRNIEEANFDKELLYNKEFDYGKVYVESGLLLPGNNPQVVFTSSGEEHETNDYVDEFGNVKVAETNHGNSLCGTSDSGLEVVRTETVSNDSREFNNVVEIHPVGETYSLKDSLLGIDGNNGIDPIHEEFMPDAEEILGKIQTDTHVEFERRRSSLDSYVTANTVLDTESNHDATAGVANEGLTDTGITSNYQSNIVSGAVGGDIFKISEVEQRALQRELDSFDAFSLQKRIQEKLAKENESMSSSNSANSNDSMVKYYSSDVLAENSTLFKSRMNNRLQGSSGNNKAANQYINQGKHNIATVHGFGVGATSNISSGALQKNVNLQDEMFYKRRTIIESGNSSEDLKNYGSTSDSGADEAAIAKEDYQPGNEQKFAVYDNKKHYAEGHKVNTKQVALHVIGGSGGYLSSSSSSNGGTSRSNSVHPASHIGSSSHDGSNDGDHQKATENDETRPEEVEAWMLYMRRILNERIRNNLLAKGSETEPANQGSFFESPSEEGVIPAMESKKNSPHSSNNSENKGSDKLVQLGGWSPHSQDGSAYSTDSRHQQKYSGFIEYYSNKKEGESGSGRAYSIRSKISTESSGSLLYHEIMVSMDNGIVRELGNASFGGSGANVVGGTSSGPRRKLRANRGRG